MLAAISQNEFELVKKCIADRMVKMLIDKSDDTDTFKALADLDKQLNKAQGAYIDIPSSKEVG